jgi:hypothetical protein
MKVDRPVGIFKFLDFTLAAIIFCLRTSVVSIYDGVMVIVQTNGRFYTFDFLVVS